MPEIIIAAARLYLTADAARLVAEGDPDGATLYCAPGDEIPLEAAERFGLVEGTLPDLCDQIAAAAEAEAAREAEEAAAAAAAKEAEDAAIAAAQAEAAQVAAKEADEPAAAEAAKEAATGEDKEAPVAEDKEAGRGKNKSAAK